jgi:hypothetical protein
MRFSFSHVLLKLVRKRFILLVCIFLFTLHVNGQKASSNCDRIKSGTFYLYPKNSSEYYEWRREGDHQFEKNLATGDSTAYSLTWMKDCDYTLKIVKTSEHLKPEARTFFAEHVIYHELVNLTEEYYVVKGRIDKRSGKVLREDTIWFKPKADYVSNKLFEYIKDPRILKKQHFSDTSKYAVLYVYRTPKTWAFMATVNMYLDDVPICTVNNNSAFAFKIFKEGAMKITANVETGKMAEQPLQVEFGKPYYLKTSLGLKSVFSYKIPILALNAKEAQLDFEGIPYGQ